MLVDTSKLARVKRRIQPGFEVGDVGFVVRVSPGRLYAERVLKVVR